ncbi:MAG: filamentous hemagglutinin N-terminal domain-containing protein, partial [Syntrophales bacterium]
MNTKKSCHPFYHRRGITPFRRKLLCLIVLFFFSSNVAFANPNGPQVVNGNVSFNTQGNTLTITNSPNSIINWQGFSIGINELTRFIQQSGNSAILNRVIGQDPSAILGALQSNGRVFLINPNGILFGAGARIDVNGLIASTLNLSNQDFLAGKYNFTAGLTAGSIENQGTITTPTGGQVYLIAPDIKNTGIINSPKGEVILAAGRSVQLVDSTNPDIAVVVSAPENSVVNLGQIIANSGRIGIYGGLISQKGIVRADSAVVDENGQILFKATKGITLDKDSITTASGPQGGKISIQSETDTTLVSGTVSAAGSEGQGGEVKVLGKQVGLIDSALVDASGTTGGGTVLVGGDYQGKNPDVQNATATYVGPDATIRADATEAGNGGKVIVWADDATRFYGTISARGGAQSGNGGFIETSGKNLIIASGDVNASAPMGKSGTWLLDPNNITISTGGNTNISVVNPFESSDDSAVLNNVTLGNALINGTNVTVQTQAAGTNTQAGDISVEAPVMAALGSAESATLSLNAQRNISFTADGSITNGTGTLNVNLNAGTDVGSTNTPGTNVSSIIMASGSSITTGGGNVTATAKTNGITLAGVNTGGGNLTVDSKGGAIAQNSALTVNGVASFTAGSNSINLSTQTNSFGGTVDFNTTGANDVSVKASSVAMAASSVGGNLAVTATAGSITDSGAITVGSDATFTALGAGGALTLNDGLNGVKKLTIDTVGSFAVTGDNTTALTDLTIKVNPATAAESSYGLTNFTGVTLALTDSGANLELGANTLPVNFALTAKSGNISDTGAVDITGSSSFTALGNNAAINMDTLQSNGAITLSTTGAAGNATIVNDSALVLGASTIGGNLTATATTGTITQTGALTVGGTGNFVTTAADQGITLGDTANAITGDVTFTTNGTNNLSHVAIDNGATALKLGASTIKGNLSATAGEAITNTGALTVAGTSSFTTDVADKSITINNAGNALTGSIAVNTTGTGDATIVNTLATDLAASNVGGNLAVTATAGSITDSGAITVGSDATFTALGAGGAVTLNDGLNGVKKLTIDTVGSFAVTGDNTTALTDLTIKVNPATAA